VQKLLGQNHFAARNQHVLTFLHPILMSRVKFLSTAVVAPRLKNSDFEV
jgi:hypothetical protein